MMKAHFLIPSGYSSGWRSWSAAEPVPRGDSHHQQVHPHAGGWGALQIGTLHHPHLTEEPSQHGAEDQEEDLHSPAE